MRVSRSGKGVDVTLENVEVVKGMESLIDMGRNARLQGMGLEKGSDRVRALG